MSGIRAGGGRTRARPKRKAGARDKYLRMLTVSLSEFFFSPIIVNLAVSFLLLWKCAALGLSRALQVMAEIPASLWTLPQPAKDV